VRRSCSLGQVGGFKGKVRKARVSFRYRAELPAEQSAAARVCRVPASKDRLHFECTGNACLERCIYVQI
jgi:hypothetical protein